MRDGCQIIDLKGLSQFDGTERVKDVFMKSKQNKPILFENLMDSTSMYSSNCTPASTTQSVCPILLTDSDGVPALGAIIIGSDDSITISMNS